MAEASCRNSEDINRVGCHPKPDLQSLLELTEEIAVARCVLHINQDAHKVVFEYSALVMPKLLREP